jgi:hypothetical protein
MNAEIDVKGVLFETGSAKWLELVPQNARFHSNKDNATPVLKSVFDDPAAKASLLDHHNVDWYRSTIVWQAL